LPPIAALPSFAFATESLRELPELMANG